MDRTTRMAEYKDLIAKMNDFELRVFVQNIIRAEEGKDPKHFDRIQKIMWYNIFPPSMFPKKTDQNLEL